MDGNVAIASFFVPKADDRASYALQDAIRAKHGDEAAANMSALGQLPIGTWHQDMLSGCVRVLYTESDERMGLELVQQLAVNVEVRAHKCCPNNCSTV